MPTVDQLAKLFHALGHQDWPAARELALAVADQEERAGHHVAADRLRGSLLQNGRVDEASRAPTRSPSPFSTSLMEGALTKLEQSATLDSIALRPRQRRELDAVLSEWRCRDRLARHSVPRRAKLFFYGPPGCGKTVTAGALARELGLPAYVVRFDAIVGALLGQTALRLRELFRYAQETACVIVIDEIDALGKRRGSVLDVGELDRVVIALMQGLEHSQPAGFIVASSNVPRLLDEALARRFDLALPFPAPTRKELESYWRQRAKTLGTKLTAETRRELLAARDYSTVNALVLADVRRRLLQED